MSEPSITLHGMTWSHPRGYDPMVACSAAWRERTGVEISWDKRSLQDFESFPVEDLAQRYDLIVIDHPHVGQITAEGCLSPLDRPGRDAELAALAAGSVGASFPSYTWRGRQWAFPIDAAAQVQAWRPDRIGQPLVSWGAAVDLARRGGVLCPMRPPHSLMSFYTLTANLGHPCAVVAGPLVDRDAGLEVYERIAELVSRIDPACFDMDPIAVFEAMAEPDSPIGCAPLIYGYVSYAIAGFRPVRLGFADIPVLGSSGPSGSALGGTGIAVSARSSHIAAATEFAYWIAGGPSQRGLYAASGGQSGHAAAWADPAVNASVHGFYRHTRATLDGAWVRPRHDGYMPFQHWAADRLNQGLRAREGGRSVIADLDRAFEQSFRKSS
jgi:multiple sugar transport system substrate-binding protein